MKKFFVFTSHRLNEEQINDAKSKFDTQEFVYLPSVLQEKWSNVPAYLTSLDNFVKPFYKFLQENAKQGDVIMIQGDFGLSYNLIDYAKSLGLMTIYATTKRDSVEKDGVKISVFKHVRFRVYK